MTRKLLAHEQKLTAIVKVFQKDSDLLAISPDIEFPAEPNNLSITEEEFRRSQDTLKALDIQWAHSKGSSVKFFAHSNGWGSMAYGYQYSCLSKLSSLPDLSYSRIRELGFGTYYKHVKGNWYLYAEYREW